MTTRALWLSTVALVLGGCAGAIAEVPVVTPHPPDAPAPLARATVDRWAAARSAYDAAVAHGFDAAACTDVAGRFEAASATHDGGLAEAAYMVGLVRQRCGDAAGASVAFHRAVSLRGTLCGARVAIAIEHEAAGRTDEARSELEQAVQGDARCAEAYVNLARLQRRQPDEASLALDNLRRALAIDARSMAAFDQMALVYLDQAVRARGAERHVQGGGVEALAPTVASHRPDEASRLLDLAGVVCRQAQLVDPDYAPLYNTWALIDVQQGFIVEALAMLERAMQLDTTFFEAAMNFGELTLSFRGYDDAATAFERASVLRPDAYDAWVGLGAARRGLGELDAAQASYEHAIAVDPARPEAYFDLGLLDQDHRGGDVAAMRRARAYYEDFVARAEHTPALAPVVEAVTRTCPATCGAGASAPRRRAHGTCAMGRLQQIEETLCLLDGGD